MQTKSPSHNYRERSQINATNCREITTHNQKGVSKNKREHRSNKHSKIVPWYDRKPWRNWKSMPPTNRTPNTMSKKNNIRPLCYGRRSKIIFATECLDIWDSDLIQRNKLPRLVAKQVSTPTDPRRKDHNYPNKTKNRLAIFGGEQRAKKEFNPMPKHYLRLSWRETIRAGTTVHQRRSRATPRCRRSNKELAHTRQQTHADTITAFLIRKDTTGSCLWKESISR